MDLSKFKQFYHDIKDEIKDLHKHLKPDANSSEHVGTQQQQNHQQHQYQPSASHQHAPAQHQSYGVNDTAQEKQPQGAWVHGPPAFQQTPYGGPPPTQAQQPPAAPISHGHAHSQVNVIPTQAELDNVQMAASKLWDLDVNRLEPGRDFQINLQNATKVYANVDAARDPFFKHVHENIFRRLPTYNLFYCLLDNYHSHTGTSEKVTSEEIREQNAFIAELLKTPVIQYCHQYLAAKRLAPQDLSQFGKLLQEIWFTLYKREVANDSSAFEHTFVGEIRSGKGITGFHNWIQFFYEERKGTVNYQGYILPRGCRASQPERAHVLSLQLSWHGEVKPVSTFFMGSSPEFEVALYTLIFLAGNEDNYVNFEGCDMNLKCHRFRNRDGQRLGSCYPVCS